MRELFISIWCLLVGLIMAGTIFAIFMFLTWVAKISPASVLLLIIALVIYNHEWKNYF